MTARQEQIKKAKVKITRYCAMGERSPRQVKEKLTKSGLSAGETALVMEALIANNFLNEKRFASAFCNDKLKFNGWGKNRLKLELKQHQISNYLIEEALKHISKVEYQEKLTYILEKKARQLTPESDLFLKKKKLVDYAVRKGFEFDLVYQTVDQILSS